MSSNWDKYFHNICIAVASKSSCLSRHIGAIIVKDNSIVSTGYNSPPRDVPHCGYDRFMKDVELRSVVEQMQNKDYRTKSSIDLVRFREECPRKILGYESGTHMELCPAIHAEINAIIGAARKGVSIIGTTLYMNCIIPCKSCFGVLINSRIVEIVVDDIKVYDKATQFLISESKISIRKFEI